MYGYHFGPGRSSEGWIFLVASGSREMEDLEIEKGNGERVVADVV